MISYNAGINYPWMEQLHGWGASGCQELHPSKRAAREVYGKGQISPWISKAGDKYRPILREKYLISGDNAQTLTQNMQISSHEPSLATLFLWARNRLHETKLLKIIPGAAQPNLCSISTLYRTLPSTLSALSTARGPQEHVVTCPVAHRTWCSARHWYNIRGVGA